MKKEGMRCILTVCFLIIVGYILGYLIIGETRLPSEANYVETGYEVLSDGCTVTVGDSEPEEVTLPYAFELPGGGDVTLSVTLPEESLNEEWIMTWNRGMDMQAFVGDKLRMEYNTEDSRYFGFNSPHCYAFIPLQDGDEGQTLTIVYTTTGNGTTIDAMQLGDRYSLIRSATEDYLPEIFIAAFLFVLGVIYLFAGLWMQRLIDRVLYMLPLSWCVILTSLWIIVNDGIRQFYFPNVSTVRDVAYFIAGTLPLAFLRYVDEVQQRKYEKIYHVLEAGVMAIEAYFFIGYMLHIARMTKFIKVTEIVIAVCVLTILVLVIKDIVTKEIREYLVAIAGVAIFIVSGVIQVGLYALSNNSLYNGVIFEIGMFLSMIVALVNSMQSLLHVYVEKNEAQNESATKAKILASMSHEIRTPINAILGMDEMILREETDREILGYASDIRDAGKSLLSLINDILDYSKMESGMMELVPVDYDVESLLHYCQQMIVRRAQDKNLAFEIVHDPKLPKKLHGDETKIRQVIINLLTNAVKYTEKGSVTMYADFSETDENHILFRITVKDTGKGIREEDIDHLFVAFQRVDEKKNHNIEGTGLGLNISQEFAHLMGGEITVKSTYGEGSSFCLEIQQEVVDKTPIGEHILPPVPVVEEKKEAEQQPLVAPDVRLLVVDDVKMNLVVFCNLLKRTQVQIETALSGAEALVLTAAKRYDMIFLDHMMPEMDGIETMRIMKKSSTNLNRETPVIMLTANALTGAREEYMDEGFSDYLSKPVESEKLEHMIRKYAKNCAE
jgi:signal transduction histidine kinase/CheY-like chemotaxis protein